MAIRVLLRVGVALLCAAGVTVSVMARDSRLKAEQAFVYYFQTHDKAGALQRIEDSRPLNPSFQLDIAEARLKPPREGVQILTGAVHREPENAEVWLRLAQQQVAAGDPAGGKRSYARARALAPLFLPPNGPPPGT